MFPFIELDFEHQHQTFFTRNKMSDTEIRNRVQEREISKNLHTDRLHNNMSISSLAVRFWCLQPFGTRHSYSWPTYQTWRQSVRKR